MNPRVVEFAGPSGSGKSSVYWHLAASPGAGLTPLIRYLPGLLYHSRIYWLLAPLILVRFRALCRAMWLRQTPDAFRSTALLVDVLSWITARHAVALGQAWMRRQMVMIDEGFLQAGLGLSARLGPRFGACWDLYLDSLPRSTWYVLFHCPSELAAFRAMERPAGPPANLMPFIEAAGSGVKEALSGINEQYCNLLVTFQLARRLTWVSVDGELSTPDGAFQLNEAIAECTLNRSAP